MSAISFVRAAIAASETSQLGPRVEFWTSTVIDGLSAVAEPEVHARYSSGTEPIMVPFERMM